MPMRVLLKMVVLVGNPAMMCVPLSHPPLFGKVDLRVPKLYMERPGVQTRNAMRKTSESSVKGKGIDRLRLI